MNIYFRSFPSIILIIFLITSFNSYSQQKPKETKGIETYCLPASSHAELNINNVRARINAGGTLWWDLHGNPKYEIPIGSGKHSMFSAALWMGGIDINGQLKVAAQTYTLQGVDFWTGPLTTDGSASIDAAVCNDYDQLFTLYKSDIEEFISWHNDSSANQSYSIPESILNYPAHGDISLGQDYYLAPFYDNNNDGEYNPLDGDYPYYDLQNELCDSQAIGMGGTGNLRDQVLKGDQTIWWIMNDKGNMHYSSGGTPIGIEIRAQAYAFATFDPLNNMTFYSYELINRSSSNLYNTFFSQFVDVDLGYSSDDMIGCDVGRGLGYCYNGTDVDGNNSWPWAYGNMPPAIGLDFYQGPYMDSDGLDNPKLDGNGNQMIDESINGSNFGNGIIDDERLGMTRFIYHVQLSGPYIYSHFPEVAQDYYNSLRGIWKDGVKLSYGGFGHPLAGGDINIPCNFMFPDESDIWDWGTAGITPNPKKWSEKSIGNSQPGDRHFAQSTGPFTMKAGAVNYITVGIPWAQSSYGSAQASLELLKQADDFAQNLFDHCFILVEGPDAPDLTIQELDQELILYLTNRKGNANEEENFSVYDPYIPADSTFDHFYHFEGYQIFQLIDESVSSNELNNPDKARLVAQCDLKNFAQNGNPIDVLINHYYDESLGFPIPQKMVDGANEGIFHSINIKEDQFAKGNKQLVNHKKYYFMAIAYAYNEYKPYIFNDPSALDGQKHPYLPGSKDQSGNKIQATIGIPHMSISEAGGTKTNAQYGDGPEITRIEGNGNGGNLLELTESSIDKIMQPPYRLNEITYKKGNGPVEIKVIDPLNVKATNYTLKFVNAYKHLNHNVSNIVAIVDGGDTASVFSGEWELTDERTNTVYYSDLDIHQANEQLFLDLGLSIKIKAVYNPGLYDVGKEWYGAYVSAILAKANGLIGASKEYADTSMQWLDGIKDDDGGTATNWIRSGTRVDETDPINNDYDLAGIAAGQSLDPEQLYETLLDGTWAPYRLASKYKYGPTSGFLLTQNRLSRISSVDIVITPDKSKWTRCPVIETGEDDTVSIGHARKFELRASASVDKEGNPDGTGTGMGWFPGYAINIETGERLNMMFGEDSWLAGENGNDMMWNPTANIFTPLGDVLFGGKHFIYVFSHSDHESPQNNNSPLYDEGAWAHSKLFFGGNSNKRIVYSQIMWTSIPLVKSDLSFKDPADIVTEVKIKLRVSKPYQRFYSTKTTGANNPQNNNYPMYQFSMSNLATELHHSSTAKSALDSIRVVPNPYYAYSSYEINELDTRVKLTNLPEYCQISIYTLEGHLVRNFKKNNSMTYWDWDLKNNYGIPIAGGIYLIHIKASNIGEKTLKWSGSFRNSEPADF